MAGQPFLDKPGGLAGGGTTQGTSLASRVLRKLFPQKVVPNSVAQISGTRVLEGTLGRCVPYAGWGLIAYECFRQLPMDGQVQMPESHEPPTNSYDPRPWGYKPKI